MRRSARGAYYDPFVLSHFPAPDGTRTSPLLPSAEASGLPRAARFQFRNKERIVEPDDLGIHNGSVEVLAYQIGSFSSVRLAKLAVGAQLFSPARPLSKNSGLLRLYGKLATGCDRLLPSWRAQFRR